MKKYLFIDRDGTLVYEPHDHQVDALEKVRFLPYVVPALLRLQDAGFTLVMVSNQDGLGTESFPLETFTTSHQFILNTLESQGLSFEQVLICPHKKEDGCECRKPNLGLVRAYLNSQDWDREHSYFIGDRDTDMQMGINMGIKSLRVRDNSYALVKEDEDLLDESSPFAKFKPMTWTEICDFILQKSKSHRTATVSRHTKETQIDISVDLDHSGQSEINTGIGFFDHMLDQIATHAAFSLKCNVVGDLHIDSHHTIEDTAIALGSALKEALGDKRGIGRFGFIVPMDELSAKVLGTQSSELVLDVGGTIGSEDFSDSTISVALDISGRPHVEFSFDASFTREAINGFETQMVPHFFESLAVAMGLTLHMSVTQGNAHHQVEALFKAFGRALRPAISVVGNELPSSKGSL